MKRLLMSKGLVFLFFWSIILILSFVWPINRWIGSFIRNDEYRVPYVVIFFAFLLVIYFFSERLWEKKFRPAGILSLGALFGLIFSIVSLLFVESLQSNGIDNMARSIKLSGLSDFLIFRVWLSLILGGWFFGGLVSAFSFFL